MIILHESVYSLSMTQNSGETQCAIHQLPECPFVIGRTQGLVGRSILRAGLWQLLFGSLEMASEADKPDRPTGATARSSLQGAIPSAASPTSTLCPTNVTLHVHQPWLSGSEPRQRPPLQLNPEPEPCGAANLLTFQTFWRLGTCSFFSLAPLQTSVLLQRLLSILSCPIFLSALLFQSSLAPDAHELLSCFFSCFAAGHSAAFSVLQLDCLGPAATAIVSPLLAPRPQLPVISFFGSQAWP